MVRRKRAEIDGKWKPFSLKHKLYIQRGIQAEMSVAEGSVRGGKTIDNCIIAAQYLEYCQDQIHLASGSTEANARLNIGYCNGFGIEELFKGRCFTGKFKENNCLFIDTKTGRKILIFAGAKNADSYKKILGNSYGLWIATEINEHYDCDDSQTSFIKVAFARQAAAVQIKRLWDLNPSNPNAPIYKNYIDKYQGGEQHKSGYFGNRYYPAIYNYQAFTIDDNLSVTEARKKSIKAQYDPLSAWYRRDILGERLVAEGLIYQAIADNPDMLIIKKDNAFKKFVAEGKLKYIEMGVDFGGNASSHGLSATAILPDGLITLKAKRYNAAGVDVDEILKVVVEFAEYIENEYGFVDILNCDHMNAIINSINNNSKYTATAAYKPDILDRIQVENSLISRKKVWFVEGECDDLIEELSAHVWDEKAAKEGIDERKDTNLTLNDVTDSWEYSWSRYINQFLDKME